MKKMLAAKAFFFVFSFSVLSFPMDATAESVCVDRVKFIERLKESYGERQVSNGINYNGVVVEVFASQEGHFTILATSPDGVSCLVASGDSWQESPILKAESGI